MNTLQHFIVNNPNLFSANRFRLKNQRPLSETFISLQEYGLFSVDRLSSLELQELQRERLNYLLEYAYRYAPFWREKIKNSGLHPKALRSVSDLSLIAPTSKAELRTKSIRMRSTSQKPYSILPDSTSGSTGEPFRFYLDANTAERKTALIFRGLRWLGKNCGHNLIRIRSRDLSLIASGVFVPMKEFEDLETIIPLLEKENKFVLHSHASTLTILAEKVMQKNAHIKPCAILTTSEHCSEKNVKLLQTAFSCPVSNWYSSREVDNIAQLCKEGSMHINIDQCVVEILDDKGRNLPEGQAGNIALTFFNNLVMPFIRYINGDKGTILPGTCTCGLQYPRLLFQGRSVDIMTLPNGKIIHAFSLMEPMQKRAHIIRQFQIVRKGPWEFNIKVSLVSSVLKHEEVISELETLLGKDAVIVIEEVTEVFSAGQKNIPFISLYKQ